MNRCLNPYLIGTIAALIIACLAANAEANDDPLCDSICRYAERRANDSVRDFHTSDKPQSERDADFLRDQRQLSEDARGTFEPRLRRHPAARRAEQAADQRDFQRRLEAIYGR